MMRIMRRTTAQTTAIMMIFYREGETYTETVLMMGYLQLKSTHKLNTSRN